MPWRDEDGSRSAERFTDEALESYVRTTLLPGSPIAVAPTDLHPGAMVVNVRRGDFFSVPPHKAEFGMDTAAYSTAAVHESVAAHGAPDEIIVVSDDVGWCRQNLGGLADISPTRFRDGDVADDLAAVVHATRLVIPNSTFSYWGGYIGDVLHPEREVLAPWLFSRQVNGGRAYQLAPGWHRVDTIPEGWDRTGP